MSSLLTSRDSALICMTLEQRCGVVGENAMLIVVSDKLTDGEVEALWCGAVFLGDTKHLS